MKAIWLIMVLSACAGVRVVGEERNGEERNGDERNGDERKVFPADAIMTEKSLRGAIEESFSGLEFGFYHWSGEWLVGALEDFENDRILLVMPGNAAGQLQLMRNGEKIALQDSKKCSLPVGRKILTPTGSEDDFSKPGEYVIGYWIALEATDRFSIELKIEDKVRGRFSATYDPDQEWKVSFLWEIDETRKLEKADVYFVSRKPLVDQILEVLKTKEECLVRVSKRVDVTVIGGAFESPPVLAPFQIELGPEISIRPEAGQATPVSIPALRYRLQIHQGAAEISGSEAAVLIRVGPDSNDEDFRKVLEAVAEVSMNEVRLVVEDEKKQGASVRALYEQGEEHFFAGRFQEAVVSWDAEIVLEPRRDPYHWQRGLAYYYAGDFPKGVKQFERHQKVNGNDVENAVWHFLCAARAKGGSVEKARKGLIPIEGDSRIPMKEVHDLFAGKGSVAEVLKAAGQAASPLYRRNQMCYAHLYLGLYFEALGKREKSLEHIEKAAVDFRMDHYMGKVAQVHFKVRSKPEKK